MPLETTSLALLADAVARLGEGFTHLPPFEPEVPGASRMAEVLAGVADRLQDNFPYFHPLYAGQMLKPPHPVARAAYALATWINPNNHALDGGRASSAMEKEAVAQLAELFGWSDHLGHLTGGGTMANLEALWVAGKLAPGRTVLASAQSHYTHQRISGVLGLPFEKVRSDMLGRMDIPALEARLAQGGVGTVVATLGTTGLGAVDPLPRILDLRAEYGFRLHIDAAYGGYFCLARNMSSDARAAFDRISEADSLVIDPHKHGLQPYGCGCVLFRDPSVGRLYKHDSPYTYFSSRDLHLGEISLECSRPGAAAVALWATQQLLPLVPGGEFARGLEASREAALGLAAWLNSDPRFVVPVQPELDIVVWAPRAPTASTASAISQQIFDAAASRNLHLALVQLPVGMYAAALPDLEADSPALLSLRSVLMKPEHLSWLHALQTTLSDACSSPSGHTPARG